MSSEAYGHNNDSFHGNATTIKPVASKYNRATLYVKVLIHDLFLFPHKDISYHVVCISMIISITQQVDYATRGLK